MLLNLVSKHFLLVPHRNTGLPNLQESYVGTLFPRSVHNGPSSLLYVIYTHCVCIYGGIFFHFYRFFGFFMDFMDFLVFLPFLLDFFYLSFLFLFRLSLKKRMGRAVLSFSFLRLSFHNKQM